MLWIREATHGGFGQQAMTTWTQLHPMAADDLVDARLQLHWAAQIVASVGRTLLEPRPDDSHPNLTWMEESWLAGNPVDGEREVRAALDTAALSLNLLEDADTLLAGVDLDGRTLEHGYQWLERTLSGALGRGVRLDRTRYEIPPHPVGKGAPFSRSHPGALAALRDWYANANAVLAGATEDDAAASTIRAWPHHFDIGALIRLAPGADPETSRSIGIGMTPGDDSYPAPYYYVNPYPHPDPLPEWRGPGHWHTEGWVGLVLTMSDIVEAGDAAAQHDITKVFLRDAIGTLRQTGA